jgi:anti-sigma factor RsiW
MPCNNLRGQLSLYGSGDLNSKDHASMSKHLKACPECRQHAESFGKTRNLLGSYAQQLSTAQEGVDLWRSIQARVADVAKRPTEPMKRPTEPMKRPTEGLRRPVEGLKRPTEGMKRPRPNA